MYQIGVDVGSTFTKYCIMNEENGIVNVFSEKTPIRQKAYFDKKCKDLLREYSESVLISCGYGRKNVFAQKNINELTALALGAEYLCPGQEIILDIGGQDTKVIIQKNGKLQEFFVNDKCAAGCGMFLGNILHLLGVDFSEIDLTGKEKPDIQVSSVCAVFAQSEIVELLATDVPAEKIIHAVVWQILAQAKMLLGKVKKTHIVLSGGLTKIPGIVDLAENVFQRQVLLPEYGEYLSAIGCAYIQQKNQNRMDEGGNKLWN